MRYTREVRFRFVGPRELCQRYIPVARTILGELDNRDRTLGGLERSSRRVALPDGAVIIADINDTMPILTIDVSLVSTPGDVSLFALYAVFPPYGTHNFPTPDSGYDARVSAPSPLAATLLLNDGEVRKQTQSLLTDKYHYVNMEERNAFGSEIDWISDTNMRLYSPVLAYTSKYALQRNAQPNTYSLQRTVKVGWRGRALLALNEDAYPFDRFIGYGIFKGWLILVISAINPGRRVDPDNFSFISSWDARVVATPILIDAAGVPTVPLDRVEDLGSFSQEPSIGYDEPVAPTAGLYFFAGTDWFNFSATGERAVRCAVYHAFSGAVGVAGSGTQEFNSYKEELVFSLDTDAPDPVPTFVRELTKVAGPTIHYEQEGSSEPDIHGDAHISATVSGGGPPLIIAYDYDLTGELVSLEADYSILSGSLEFAQNTLTENTEGISSGDANSTSASATRCDLVYRARGREFRIPYFDFRNSFTTSISRTGSFVEPYIISASSAVSADVQFKGPVNFSHEVANAVCMDLRRGYIVTSIIEGTERMEGAVSASWVSGVDLVPTMPATSNIHCKRVDTLHDFSGDAAKSLVLSRVKGVNTPDRPLYEFTRTFIKYLEYIPQAVNFPACTGDISYSILAHTLGTQELMPIARGVGGSMATDGKTTVLMSLMSTDLTDCSPVAHPDAWRNYFSACGQATHVYDFAGKKQGAFPLTGLLWASVRIPWPEYEPGLYAYGQLGMIDWVTE